MITLLEYKTKKNLEFENSKELKVLLSFCNPLVLSYYKSQIEGRKFEGLDFLLEVDGMGEEVKIKRVLPPQLESIYSTT